MDYKMAAESLRKAEYECRQIEMLTSTYSKMKVEDAYAVQLENVRIREEVGERIIGMKIGITSKGMRDLLNVNEPDYGHLFENMLILEGETCSMGGLIQPKVEGELSFCLNKTLKGPGITIANVYEATSYIVPSIEIVDSRIKNWKIKLEDTIADNGSSARFILGGRMTPIANVDMRLSGMILEKNGELINSGTAAEVLGSPAASVAWLANKLSEFGKELKAGSIVMSGAITAALPAEAGDIFTASFYGMGSVSIKFVD